MIGFGVCCVFQTSTCGSSVSQNCSYIKNPNHPSAYTSTSNCQFTIYKCDSSVCDFRLDFDQYLTNAPSATDETTGGICQVCIHLSNTLNSDGSDSKSLSLESWTQGQDLSLSINSFDGPSNLLNKTLRHS